MAYDGVFNKMDVDRSEPNIQHLAQFVFW